MSNPGTPVDQSLASPFRRRAFKWLWLGMLVATMGAWMQGIGAQWLLIDLPNAASVVALVQAAGATPMMLLALPAGVLADSFDRRRLLFWVQIYLMVAAGLLAVLSYTGKMTPAILLVLTFALGVGGAVQNPTWQSLTPELVPRHQLRSVARLEQISVNVGRALGPVMAGFMIAWFGVPSVFVAYALCLLTMAMALVMWRRPAAHVVHRERFLPAIRTGGRYAWNEPDVRRFLWRQMVFVVPGSVVWALLPVVANRILHVGADLYGIMFGIVGVGAVGGALLQGRIRALLSANRVTWLSTILYGVAALLVVIVPGFWAALPLALLIGAGWTLYHATLLAEMQSMLPNWVRARAMALMTVSFTAAQVAGSLTWGALAEITGLKTTWLLACGLTVASALAARLGRLPSVDVRRVEAVGDLDEAHLLFEPDPTSGPVIVQVTYTVSDARWPRFQRLLPRLRRARLQTGATRWHIFRSGERAHTYVELFHVATWSEHEQQHTVRLDRATQEIEALLADLSDPPPRSEHLLPPPSEEKEPDEPRRRRLPLRRPRRPRRR
ncbi:MAG TPA: MFS transporter [Propionibacteriaceae bacterium]|nr:MFS transporter [Propionibacteriaceae bacterium]